MDQVKEGPQQSMSKKSESNGHAGRAGVNALVRKSQYLTDLGQLYRRIPGAEVNSFMTLEAYCQIAYTKTFL